MKIVYAVDKDSIVTVGSDSWRPAIGQPPSQTFKAVVSLIFPISVDGMNLSDCIEFEGDSKEIARIFQTAADMLKHEQECRFPAE